MKHIFTLSFIALSISYSWAQTTYQSVYNIFQTNCATSNCHNTATSSGNLDLEGVGLTYEEKEADVYSNIYKVVPDNAYAAAKDNYLIYPGDPYRSFLMRKIANGFFDDMPLEANEGAHMPDGGVMTDYEKEVIRQWIVYGAYEDGDDVNLNYVNEYYTNGGVESVTNVPAPPAAGQGFQIHLGPFFIGPTEEVEFLSKYETLLDETVEITKFQTEMGTYSHHFIVYNFTDAFGSFDPATVPYGLRDDVDFDGKGFVLTEQYSNTLETPQGSAFKWKQNEVLDLNSHYINYDSTRVLKCDVYLNVSTQANGTAAQEMFTQLIPSTNIYIPNSGEPVTFNRPFSIPANLDVYIWGTVAHTHKYGSDFNIYLTEEDGSKGAMIYDAGCAGGVPGCGVEDFDYKHLPIRFFMPFRKVNLQDGVIAEATYINDGPTPVQWGLTSADEMMLFIIMFTLDTAGVEQPTVGILDKNEEFANVVFYPNPTKNQASILISNIEEGFTKLEIVDVNGRLVKEIEFDARKENSLEFDASSLINGIYFYRLSQNDTSLYTGKFAISK
ncbi:MAG: T9SS type A sorting domain-containing protein [Bacteroidetes bacterium]|nr:T9SS type A sorting domain-containing protein [Bacteroidota bacterium]